MNNAKNYTVSQNIESVEDYKVDFHIHSIFSMVGTEEAPHATETVEQILERAENTGLKKISIADHETTGSYQYILKHIVHIMLYGFKLEGNKG